MKNSKKQKAVKILKELKRRYPQAKVSLQSENIFQLLVAVILSAQCTDARVNIVTKELFKKYKNVDDFVLISQSKLEEEIHSTGFFRNKTKNIIATAKRIKDEFNGIVPDNMEDLLTFQGVARKTANIILYHGFGKNIGIAVDTHVFRVTGRLGIAGWKDPKKTEKELMVLFPRGSYGSLSDMIILFGRNICPARNPKCDMCPFVKICDYYKRVVSRT
ncbi:MAG: endonuclease III [Candidatus Aureabacteria bacterium]|nr:endonuclease III [Candidatus Auribacterota bacterium]